MGVLMAMEELLTVMDWVNHIFTAMMITHHIAGKDCIKAWRPHATCIEAVVTPWDRHDAIFQGAVCSIVQAISYQQMAAWNAVLQRTALYYCSVAYTTATALF